VHICRFEGFSARNCHFTVAEIVKWHNDPAGGFGCFFDSAELIAVTGVAGGWRYHIVKNINTFGAGHITGFNDGFNQQGVGCGADFRQAWKPDVGFNNDRLTVFNKPVHTAHQFNGFLEHDVRLTIFDSDQIGEPGRFSLCHEQIRLAKNHRTACDKTQR
jgi:hypothetical protein